MRSAASSWDAYGKFVAATIAYEFITGVWSDLELPEVEVLPQSIPAAFPSDYPRCCRAIQKRNAFILSGLTRPA